MRRVLQSRGKPGFGNARACQGLMKVIRMRQLARIQKEEMAQSGAVDKFFFTRDDILGPFPTKAR